MSIKCYIFNIENKVVGINSKFISALHEHDHNIFEILLKKYQVGFGQRLIQDNVP